MTGTPKLGDSCGEAKKTTRAATMSRIPAASRARRLAGFTTLHHKRTEAEEQNLMSAGGLTRVITRTL